MDVFEARAQPPLVGVLYESPEAARSAPTGDIVLASCQACGFIHNRVFDLDLVPFSAGYEVSLAHTATFADFIESVAQRLVERYALEGGTVLEIGCGGGHFMRLLANLGIARGIGVDPTLPAARDERIGDAEVSWVPAEFDPHRYEGPTPDFVCCLSVFESIPRPMAFLWGLHEMLRDRQTPIYFEVFNAARPFEADETWSIHYEQCNYFDLNSFVGLFERCGFRILDAGECYQGDQYVFVEAQPIPDATLAPAPAAKPLHPKLQRFAQAHLARANEWERRLRDLGRLGKRVALWGSGGKGISFLNTIPAARQIEFVVDINPDRQDRHLARAGQRIVAPEALVEIRPDVIVITNPLYETEIRAQAKELGLDCDFLAA